MSATDIDIAAHMVRRHFKDPETPTRRMLFAGRLDLAGMSKIMVHLFRSKPCLISPFLSGSLIGDSFPDSESDKTQIQAGLLLKVVEQGQGPCCAMPPPIKVTITGLSKPPDAQRDRGGGFAARVSSFRLLSPGVNVTAWMSGSSPLFASEARQMASTDDNVKMYKIICFMRRLMPAVAHSRREWECFTSQTMAWTCETLWGKIRACKNKR